MSNQAVKLIAVVVLILNLTIQPVQSLAPQSTTAARPRSAFIAAALLPGQTVTLLPNGQWLLLGGKGATGAIPSASIQDPTTGKVLPLKIAMLSARAWHSATLLPDGRVLIIGGIGPDGKFVPTAEIFDPSSSTPPESVSGLLRRAHHTATLLIDGSVLVAGGVGSDGTSLTTAERWESRSSHVSVLSSELQSGRRDDIASLLPDGTVLLRGGTDANGEPLSYADLYNPETGTISVTTLTAPSTPDMNLPYLEASFPSDGSTGVSTGPLIGLRFSKPLQVQSINPASIKLSGPNGETATAIRVVPAEAGMLAFVTPLSPLQPGTKYLLTIEGAVDRQGLAFISQTVSFTTAGSQPAARNGPSHETAATSSASSVESLPPLQAPPGVTALSGQALLVDGQPLANVTISIGQQTTHTDRTGRFLLQHVGEGHQSFVIEGRTANYGGNSFGLFEVGTDIKAGITNVLNYKIWMTPLDTAHAIQIPSPTVSDTIINTPIPGLKLDLPANTTISDHYGHTVHQITVTPIRLDRPPFPIPQGLGVSFYFTIQPGGAYIHIGDNSWGGARIIYPNTGNALAGTPFAFWNYDPDQKGWFVYGMGQVTPDRQEVVPNPGVSIYGFTGAMVGGPTNGPSLGPGAGSAGSGDPVDTSTGLFVYKHTDFYLPDVIPINASRVYRQGDTVARAFGLGTSITFDIFPVGEAQTYSYMDLVLPDGERIHYVRTSPGTSYSNAVFLHTATPTEFYGSTIAWDPSITPNFGGGWRLTFKDGSSWGFPESFNAPTGTRASLIFIQDRFGNTLNISRNFSNGTGDITQITSQNGRWLQFTYDSCNRIQQITDNIGRSTSYGYDSTNCNSGRLQTSTDQNGGITTYNYAENGATADEMTSIVDDRQIKYLQNTYDSNGRVHQQTLANGGTYLFSYALDQNGNVTQTNVTDPNGNSRQMTFSPRPVFPNGYQTGGFLTSETYALGKPEQETFTYNLGTPDSNPGNFVQSVTDPLGRITAYTYDALGNTTSVTHLAGSSTPAMTSYTYEPTFSRITSITDPLNDTTTFAYNDLTNQLLVTNPLGNQWIAAWNPLGQIITTQDPAGESRQFGYTGGDLTSITDGIDNTTTYLYDGAGRVVSSTDAIGERTIYAYDGLNDLLSSTDPLGEVIQLGYDANSNLTSVTDPRNNPTHFFYNNMDLLSQRTDALGNSDQYQYDFNGNLACHTDRKGQVSIFGYDAINRRTSAGYGATSCTSSTFQSSTSYTYDGGNRLKTATDSFAGTINRNYDGLDDLNYENTPQGTINYTFDLARRRKTMTVAGQSAVTYAYDPANNLTQVAQGGNTVSLTYDNVGRRSVLSLSNGVSVQYAYDADSHISSITYLNGTNILGNLAYGYDALGRQEQITGSYAQSNLPTALSSATYNADNQVATWAGAAFAYDLNGSLQNDGSKTYSWDARNQLSAISGGTTASFQYDGLGRRTSKAIIGTTTAFLYDGWNVIQELSGTTPTANLINGLAPDEIFARTDSSGIRYFLDDALGSTLGLTSSTGSVQTTYTYEPFGNTNVSGTASSNAFQYTGRENDGTGLYFYRARYYSPQYGHFISEDPMGLTAGVNVFAYALDQPTDLVDPIGTDPKDPFCSPPAPANPNNFFLGDNGQGDPNKSWWDRPDYNGPRQSTINGPGFGLTYTLFPPTNTLYLTFSLGGVFPGGSVGPVKEPPQSGWNGSLGLSSPAVGGEGGSVDNTGAWAGGLNVPLGGGEMDPIGWPPDWSFTKQFSFGLPLWPTCGMNNNSQ